ncbi:hypothetical protein B0H34DRAFT_391243 [Crassisporium funariophilum]|nr:hypothetical protein B0H34DRAFT_391243 [Crassisporium funariophilum]
MPNALPGPFLENTTHDSITPSPLTPPHMHCRDLHWLFSRIPHPPLMSSFAISPSLPISAFIRFISLQAVLLIVSLFSRRLSVAFLRATLFPCSFPFSYSVPPSTPLSVLC